MNSDNDIRREFQSKFSDFRASVPDDGWSMLEQSLKIDAAARVAVRRRWYTCTAAAVLVLLIGTVLFFRNQVDQSNSLISESALTTPEIDIKPGSGAEIKKQPETLKQAIVTHPGKVKQYVSGSAIRKGINPVRPSDPSGIIESMLRRESSTRRGMVRVPDSDALRVLRQSEENQRKRLLVDELIVVEGQKGLFAENVSSHNDNGNIVLTLSGRGGLTSFHQTVNSPMTLRSAAVAPESQYSGEPNKMLLQANNTADNISEMEHDQPVSFGITVSKSLLDNLSIETGLIYTSLYSKTRNKNSNFQVHETQRLHYLGIPLNVNYNLFSLSKLDVYASVGGIIEKDIYGEFRRTGEGQALDLNSSSQEKEVKKISQHNPQISVNAGVGVSFPIYNSLKLYGKIGGAYYFDAKNEYKTIYSDSKIVMDLNIGLRYEF